MLKMLTSIIIAIIAIVNSESRRLLTPQDSGCSTTPSPDTLTCNPNKATTSAYGAGDPHWRTFTGWHHHFQGDKTLFYYLMMPCKAKGYDHNKVTGLPWNLIVKEAGNNGHGVKWFQEVILESIDEDGGKIYYLYVRNWFSNSRIVGYYTRDINNQDIITIEQAMQQSTWVSGNPTGSNNWNLGIGRTVAVFWQNDGFIRVQFRVNGGCTNDNSIVLDFKYKDTTCYVEPPPICYRCATCGLFGDFYEPTGYLLNPYGKHCYILNKYEYQNLGFMEQTTATPKPTSSPSAPPPGTTQFGDPVNCDTDANTLARVKDAVQVAYQNFVNGRNCCNNGRHTECFDEIADAEKDTCEFFKGTHVTDTLLQTKANEFTNALLQIQCWQHAGCSDTDNTSKYAYISDVKTWLDAEQYCQNECGTSLATVTSDTENNAAINTCQSTYCWFGLHRGADDREKWFWHKFRNGISSKKLWGSNGYTFNKWAPGEPSNATKNGQIIELCGQIDKTRDGDRKWNDIQCGKNKVYQFLCENPLYKETTANMIDNDIDINMNAGRPRRGRPIPGVGKPKPKPQKPRPKPRPKPKNKPKPMKPRPKPRKRNNANDIDIKNDDDISVRRANNIKTVKDNGNNNNGYYTGSLMMKWFIIGLLFGVLLTFCIGGPLNILYKSINNKIHQYKPVMEISSSDQSDDDTKNIL